MNKLVYSREELLADHPFAKPHKEAGYDLHGGFDATGTYISPRTLHRWDAVRNWQQHLKEAGYPLIDASVQLLKRGNYPNKAQQKLLLSNGLGETMWNSLTVTGVIEARGQMLCQFVAPDLQKVIVENISETATGHLNKGLLYAHGMDEGGDPQNPKIGAHDAMWFAARDLLFGKDAYPIPEIPESIGRPDIGRLMPQIPMEYEQLILLLMNVLMIEVRAESFFSFCCDVMRDKDLFTDRREKAELAARMVERIRTDEAIHVGYLQTVISELRSFTFKTIDGSTISGAQIIDPVWSGMIEWHAVTQADFSRNQSHEAILKRLKAVPQGATLIEKFESLENRAVAA